MTPYSLYNSQRKDSKRGDVFRHPSAFSMVPITKLHKQSTSAYVQIKCQCLAFRFSGNKSKNKYALFSHKVS